MTQAVLLGDIGRVVTGKTPPKANPEFWGDELDFITPTDFEDSKYISPVRKLSSIGEQAMQRLVCPKNSVIVTCIGSDMGKVALAKKPFVSNQQINTLIVDEERADPSFVYYLLKLNRPLLRKYAESGGSTMPIINKSTFERLSFNIPNLETQKKIADILGTIDEKIELNRQMNETLEQMGQALFRHYFIDNPEAEKWEDGVVSDLITIYSGYAFKRTDFDPDGDYGLVTIKNVQDGNFVPECSDHLSSIPVKTPDYAFLNTGDILLSLTGNVGRVCIVHGENLLLNQRVAKLVGADDKQSFAYFMFRQEEFKNRLISMSRGTAQLNLSPIETKKLKMKLPPKELLSQYHEQAEPLFGRPRRNVCWGRLMYRCAAYFRAVHLMTPPVFRGRNFRFPI